MSRPPYSGFTLLEVMLALAITGGLLITVIYTLNHNLGIAERQESETLAIMLAKGKLAELRKNPAGDSGVFGGAHEGYHYASAVRDSLYPGVSEISVTVTGGRNKVTLRELIRSRNEGRQ